MNKKTAKELVFALTGMTIGFALILPEISLLSPFGVMILAVTSFLSSTEELALKRLLSVLLVLGLCMFLVVLSIYSGDMFAPQKGAPHTWFVIIWVVLWLVGGLNEYRKWKQDRADERAASEQKQPIR